MTEEVRENTRKWKSKVIVLSFGAALMFAFYNSSDSVILNNFLKSDTHGVIGPALYVVIGSWIGLLVTYFSGLFFGNRLIKGYNHWVIPSAPGMQLTFISGLSGAFDTFFVLYGLSNYDLGLVVILGAGSLLIQAFLDLFQKKLMVSKVVLPTCLVIGGVIVSSITEAGFAFEALITVLIIRNFFNVVTIWSRQKASRLENSDGVQVIDSVNFQLWRFIWFALVATVLVFGYLSYEGYQKETWVVFQSGVLGAFGFICLSQIFAFFEGVWQSEARREGNLSVVTIFLQTQIFFALIIAYTINALFVGAVGPLETDILSITMKVIGGSLVFVGIVFLVQRGLLKSVK